MKKEKKVAEEEKDIISEEDKEFEQIKKKQEQESQTNKTKNEEKNNENKNIEITETEETSTKTAESNQEKPIEKEKTDEDILKTDALLNILDDLKRSKELATESQLKFKNLFDSSADAIMIIDIPDYKFTSYNTSTLKLFNAKNEKEFLSKKPWDLSPKYQSDKQLSKIKSKKMIELALKKGNNFFEWTHKTIDNKEFIATVLLSSFELKNKKFIQATVRDITKEKKLQEELKTVKQRIEFVLGATKTGMTIIDSKFNLIYVDPRWQEIYGNYKGKKCYKYFMQRKKICQDCGVPKAIKTKKPVVYESILPKENNRPIKVHTIPFKNEKGEWLFAEINLDISEIQEKEKMLNSVTENSPGVIFRCKNDSKWTMKFISDKIKELSGYSKEDFIDNKKRSYESIIHPEDRKIVEQTIKTALKNKNQYDLTYRIIDSSKKIKFINEIGRGFYDNTGKIIYIDGFITDVTEKKKTEEILQVYERGFDDSPNSMVLVDYTDNKPHILKVNKTFTKYYGYSEKEAIGKNPKILKSGKLSKEYYKKMWKALLNPKIGFWNDIVINKRKNKSFVEVMLTITSFFEKNKLKYFIASHVDLSKTHENIKKISKKQKERKKIERTQKKQ